MAYANISHTLPQEHVTEIINAINLINSRLPFLVNLNEKERQRVRKIAPRDTERTDDILFALTNHADIFPASFDGAEYQRDIALHDHVSEFKQLIGSLADKLYYTELALGGEIMKATSQGYELVQSASKTVPGIQGLAKKMKERYKHSPKKTKSDTSA